MKKGFTLAEVLVTLGVIGVVAAMTLPTLVHKYKMKVYENGFRKEYSTIQNAINYITATEDLTQCYAYHSKGGYIISDSDCEVLYELLKKHLNLQEADRNMYKTYAKKDEVLSKGGKSINSGVNYDTFIMLATPYILNDGSIIFLPDLLHNDYRKSVIIFDINGKKSPNKWGYDIFWMNLTQHKSGEIRLTDELASLKEKGGRYPREILRGQMNSNDKSIYW